MIIHNLYLPNIKTKLCILFQVQFTCALVLGANGIRTGCEFPLWMHYTLIFYMMSFIVLFGNFYVKAYLEKVRNYNKLIFLSLVYIMIDLKFIKPEIFLLRSKRKLIIQTSSKINLILERTQCKLYKSLLSELFFI